MKNYVFPLNSKPGGHPGTQLYDQKPVKKDSGRFWTVLEGSGRFWKVLEGSGKVLEGHGKFWKFWKKVYDIP